MEKNLQTTLHFIASFPKSKITQALFLPQNGTKIKNTKLHIFHINSDLESSLK